MSELYKVQKCMWYEEEMVSVSRWELFCSWIFKKPIILKYNYKEIALMLDKQIPIGTVVVALGYFYPMMVLSQNELNIAKFKFLQPIERISPKTLHGNCLRILSSSFTEYNEEAKKRVSTIKQRSKV